MADEPQGLKRREFLNVLLGAGVIGTAGSITYPVAAYLLPPPARDATPDMVVAAKEGDLAPNSGKIVRFGVKPALLVHKADGSYSAFYASCTHLDCTVQYRPDLKMIHCACHNGIYDLQGRNVSGPPPRPLEPLKVKQRGNEILIVREA
jgi:cytochrome b6-f complex iron-sulfur subunit